jgi:starch synthase
MNANLRSAEVLRFEIGVNAAAYGSLVAGLRELNQAPSNPRTFRRAIKASVELDLASRRYLIRSLGRHTLPRAVAVNPGSRTHSNLSGVLTSSLREQDAHDLASFIEKIIDAAPQISGDALPVFREDLEFHVVGESEENDRPTQTIAIARTLAPSLFLDIDDSPTLVVPERPEGIIELAVVALRNEARLLSPIKASVSSNTIEISARLTLPLTPTVPVDLFLHWGSYEELAPSWQDEPLLSVDGATTGPLSISHKIHAPHRGRHGATLFLRARGSTESVWLGRFSSDDAHFYISSDDSTVTQERAAMLSEMRTVAADILALSADVPHTLTTQIETIQTHAPHIGIGAILKEVVDSGKLHVALGDWREKILEHPQHDKLRSLLLNYGIGEVVFATPEGPHAAAGGLAQVISGLPPELCERGIPVSIITPLYSGENGNKHPSAQHLLAHGVRIGGKVVIPEYVGSITVNLGPTYHYGTTSHRRAPSALPIKVFLAQVENLRIFLLSNSSVFDQLYRPVYADEQLRRAVVLSRAALEVIATDHFGIKPSAIISNDWMTACVPALAALDNNYRNVPWLRGCKTIHMIHNGGADYHGRLPAHINNEDLWPMLNLAPEHFFGFRDPHSSHLLNFTMAAAQHATGGILTVSQPYAQQICAPGGGDGVDYVLQHRRGSVFGISNGINRVEIDRYLSSLRSDSKYDLSTTAGLLKAKADARCSLQETYGLQVSPQARLVSFVGRMAEQKGLTLLSAPLGAPGISALEDILVRHSDVQLLFAGPLTEGDRSAHDLRQCLWHLASKYPGRVAVHFDYVPHSKALEIIFASAFFLMPSRFEPGGITQLEALAAGTLVIGRNVGGISATIENYDSRSMSGNGFLFNDFTPGAFAATADWALSSARDTAVYEMLVSNARSARHAWADRVPAYQAMLQRIILGQEELNSLGWNAHYQEALKSLTVG